MFIAIVTQQFGQRRYGEVVAGLITPQRQQMTQREEEGVKSILGFDPYST